MKSITQNSKGEYLYFITNNTYDNFKRNNTNQVITKVKRENYIPGYKLTDNNEGEGPFTSIPELTAKSCIFNSITSLKRRHKIKLCKNILEIKEIIFTNEDSEYDKTFIDSLYHIMVGEIKRNGISGVHKYDPKRVKILELIYKDDKTGAYSAKISKLDEKTNKWIEKKNITDFFPDEWSTQQLFIECDYAYRNKKHSNGNVYYGYSYSNIKVKFIIKNEKILTFYPVSNPSL